jgi:hypothetical protein
MRARAVPFRRSLPWLVLALVVLIPVLVGIGRYGGPAYRSDEIGYLSKAAAIAGLDNRLATSWYGGYSLLLSPFFRLAGSVEGAWPAVIVVNGLAVLVALGCYWRCLRSTGLCTREAGFRLILLSLLFLGTTAYIGWAFTNCLMMALVAVLALLLSARTSSPATAWLIALVAGFGCWVHPTGVFLVFAAAIASLVRADRGAGRRQAVVILAIGLLMALSYAKVVHPWISSLQGGSGGHYEGQIRGYLEQLRDQPLATLTTLTVGLLNGFATSSIATLGYLAAALLALPQVLRTRGSRLAPVLLFLLLTWLALVGFSAFLTLTKPDDLQLAFFQRYTQPVLPGVLIFGLALSPPTLRRRLPALLLSAAAILLALLAATFLRTYDDNFSVIDGLSAATIFLSNENARVMLATGLVATVLVQLGGWPAYLLVAGTLWFLGWQGMDRIHRKVLASDSRIPALTRATRTLSRAGLKACVHVVKTPLTPSEHTHTMDYYLSGQQIAAVDAETLESAGCDVILRPADSEAHDHSRLFSNSQPVCRPMILDTFSSYVLEDCSNGAYRASGVHARLLDVNRDLIDLDRALRLTPPGYRLVHATHTSAMGSDGRNAVGLPGSISRRPGPVRFRKDQILLYGAYVDLEPGTYRALFDGLTLSEGSLKLDVRSDKGKRGHATAAVGSATGGTGGESAAIDFTLDEPVKDLVVRLFSASQGKATLPTSLLIYRAASASSERSAVNPPRSGAAEIPSTSRR